MTHTDAHQVEFKPALHDAVAAYMLWRRHRYSQDLAMGVSAALAVIALAVLIFGIAGLALLAVALLAILTSFLAGPWVARSLLRRAITARFVRDPRLHEPRTWSWGPEGLTIYSCSYRTQGAWSAFSASREDAHIMLIYRSPAEFVFIPKSILTPAQLASLQAGAGQIAPRRSRLRQ